jgi:chlorophyll synthase
MQSSNTMPNGVTGKLSPIALLELLKPITWFPPMWAFLCGAVSVDADLINNVGLLLAGVALTGPLVCGASQIVNDWYDREVDAINEPNRPIPSGRVPGKIGFYYALAWSILGLIWGATFGPWVFAATFCGLLLAWAYSAPPFRFKANGWIGNAAVGISYEGLAWITGAALMLEGQIPPTPVIFVALLYSLGAHGIMTLNDFKSIDGDRQMGVRSLPAQLGADKAAKLACVVMLTPQLVVLGLLNHWQSHWQSVAVILLIGIQLLAMRHMLAAPRERAPWYNGTGVTAYVTGMMIAATALPGAYL